MTKYNWSNFYYSYEKNNLIEDFSLLSGPMGIHGDFGDEGIQGETGPEGQMGNRGPKGDRGSEGKRGIIGPVGPKGNKGETGFKGKTGLRGEIGDKGKKGIPGPPGIRGPPGPKGFTGPLGIRGDQGEKGAIGKQGEKGYKGGLLIDYGSCTEYDFSDSWEKTWGFKCGDNKIVTRVETNCRCGDLSKDLSKKNTKKWSTKVCGRDTTDDVKRDCTHKFTCCKLDTYDFPESEYLLWNRVFPEGRGGMKEERFINKLWIILKPDGLNKSYKDYPKGFFETDIDIENPDYIKILEKDDTSKQIPYASECNSKYCSKIGQLCVDKKVCKNETNMKTECYKPPCWHKTPEITNNCPDGNCHGDLDKYQNLGQQCTNKKICDMRKNDNCDDPPCWNKIDVLEKCPGRRCPTPGQQCTSGFDTYNRTGYVCKDQDHKEPLNNPPEWCRDPPCWYPADKTVSVDNCAGTGNYCKIYGQKCVDRNGKVTKICLNQPHPESDCNGPCWFSVNENQKCNSLLANVKDDSIDEPICKRDTMKGKDGEEIKDSMGSPIFLPGKCTFLGNCENVGQKCFVNADGNEEERFECMNTHKYLDQYLPSFDRTLCNKKPCWVPIKEEDSAYFSQLKSISDNMIYKNDRDLRLLKQLKEINVRGFSYRFTIEDRAGTINFQKLYKFMNTNWQIFEANCIEKNLEKIWEMFTGNKEKSGTMDYYQFSGMMKKLKVEKFKYREGVGRIYPKFMPTDSYEKIFKYFKLDN